MLTNTERSQALFALVQSLAVRLCQGRLYIMIWILYQIHILDTTSLNPFGCTSSQWVRSHNPVQQTSGSPLSACRLLFSKNYVNLMLIFCKTPRSRGGIENYNFPVLLYSLYQSTNQPRFCFEGKPKHP